MDKDLTIRFAVEEDVETILSFINALAAYEKLEDQVVATPEILKTWLFDKKKAEVLLAEIDGKAVAFALFFHNFSTFLGRAGIYLEDLFVLPEYRKCGIGKKMMQTLANIAVSRGCGRFEWSCLDWNTPSIGFYKSLGAVPMDEWTVYRLTGSSLENVSNAGE